MTKGNRKHLTAAEVDKLIAAAKGSRNEARDRCLLLLKFRHGLRVSCRVCGVRRGANGGQKAGCAVQPEKSLLYRCECGYFFSKLFFSPQLGHFCGLHLASFSNPHLLHLKFATFFPPYSASQGKSLNLPAEIVI
jgi:hypothetical protein